MSESEAEAMSKRELEEFIYGIGLVRSCAEDFAGSDPRADIQLKVCDKAEQVVAEVRRSHAEAAELRERVGELEGLLCPLVADSDSYYLYQGAGDAEPEWVCAYCEMAMEDGHDPECPVLAGLAALSFATKQEEEKG